MSSPVFVINLRFMNLGKNIRKYREKAGLSRDKLAFKCNGKFTSLHLMRVEHGQVKDPGIKLVKTLADALEVTVDDLLK